MEKKSEIYSKMKNDINPLDLVGFKGADIVSEFIQILEDIRTDSGIFSHVGIIVNSELLPWITQLKPDRLYVMESTMSMSLGGITDGVPDVVSGKGRFGVQIRDLEETIEGYTSKEGAEVAWCKLIDNPWLTSDRKKLISSMKKVYNVYGRATYELSLITLIAAVVPCCRIGRDILDIFSYAGREVLSTIKLDDLADDQFVFCSELVAIIYKAFGIINKDIDPEDVLPVNFLGTDESFMKRLVNDPIYLSIENKSNEKTPLNKKSKSYSDTDIIPDKISKPKKKSKKKSKITTKKKNKY